MQRGGSAEAPPTPPRLADEMAGGDRRGQGRFRNLEKASERGAQQWRARRLAAARGRGRWQKRERGWRRPNQRHGLEWDSPHSRQTTPAGRESGARKLLFRDSVRWGNLHRSVVRDRLTAAATRSGRTEYRPLRAAKGVATLKSPAARVDDMPVWGTEPCSWADAWGSWCGLGRHSNTASSEAGRCRVLRRLQTLVPHRMAMDGGFLQTKTTAKCCQSGWINCGRGA